MKTPSTIPSEISEAAVIAADCFVEYCLQHAAYLGDREHFTLISNKVNYTIYTCTSFSVTACMYIFYLCAQLPSQVPPLDTHQKIMQLQLIAFYYLKGCYT